MTRNPGMHWYYEFESCIFDQEMPFLRETPACMVNLPEQVKTGYFSVSDGKHEPEAVRVQLSRESLILQKEEYVSVPVVNHNTNFPGDDEEMTKERTVTIRRQRIGGLGLSIKGGAEHGIPILVSRIFKDQAADQTGQLYVGDAILKVNGVDIEDATHDDAVAALKNAGAEVRLTVRHFKAATPYLRQNVKRPPGASNENGTGGEYSHMNGPDSEGSEVNNGADAITVEELQVSPKLEKRWTDVLMVPLLMARITRYMPGSDKIRNLAFEVIAMDGTSSGVIHCNDSAEQVEWIKAISANVATLNAQSMKITNNLLPHTEQVLHMGWLSERLPASRSWQHWKPKFLAIRGSEIMIFDSPPVNTRDWVRCERSYKLCEVLCRLFKESELADERPNSFSLQSGSGSNHYLSTETKGEMHVWLNAVQKATFTAVAKLGSKTYGCTWRGKVVGLTLDFSNGFTLFDAQNKQIILWKYRFSQLKGSSDDGKAKVKLHFQNSSANQIETQELECPNLTKLLYCMHAFLSAKLAAVDPIFMKNTAQLEVPPENVL
ncbi:gamma-2-syntrophin-like isoform X2 [Ptychodera flava]|uniref:gamma-2-syntrophin-like isoform X2 n=1 Tax=Ptychodera flava TaxID=63121 RepID=UPI003969D0AD